MATSETKIHGTHVETAVLHLELGSKVEVISGPLSGMQGTLVDFRVPGRALISVQLGTFVEIHQYRVRAHSSES